MKRAVSPRSAPRLFGIALLGIFALTACGGVKPAPASLAQAQPAESRVVIFHSNDIHGKIDNFAKVAAILDAERKSGAEVFYFCAGDNFTGNPVIDQYVPPGEPMLELLNRLGVTLMCPGNHEFDYGLDNLRRFADKARFTMVSANIEPLPRSFPQLRQSMVLKTRSGLQIAVFGLIQIEPGNGLPSTHPDKVKGLVFSEPLAKALEMKKLRAAGNVLIGLTHIGFDQDMLLAGAMPELDAIIGGHSHTLVDPAEMVNGVLVAQAGSDNKFLGRVELLVRDGRVVEKEGVLIDLKGPMAEAADVQAMIVRFNQNPAFARVIAEAPQEISGKDALGCLMTDAIRVVYGLDIAFQNEGGIRLGQLPKKITLKDVYTLDPFGNQVVQFALTAAEIRGLIASSFEKGGEIDLQVSGISYVVRSDSALKIKEIQLRDVNGAPLAEDKKFQIGISSYVASSYKFAHADPGRSLMSTTADALIQYLQGSVDLAIYRDVQRAFWEKTAETPRP